MDLLTYINSGFAILDGATGSNLIKAGMEAGCCPEQWIVEHPDVFIKLQEDYVKAGTRILYTPTFTCNEIKLEEYDLQDKQEELTKKLVSLTREAIKRSGVLDDVFVVADMSMTGQQLEPMGKMKFETLVDVYKKQAKYFVDQNVDGFVIETMLSLQETRAAVIAIKEVCDLPIMATMTFEDDGKTLYGTSPETVMAVLSNMGLCAVGVNCSSGPDKMVDIVKKMSLYGSVPIITKPNAGLPVLENGVSVFKMEPDEFAKGVEGLIDAGASVLGGCCGTTPDHIKAVTDMVKNKSLTKRPKAIRRVLTTERNVTPIELDGKFIIVGERINPTGKKALQEELREGKLDIVLEMAEEQIANGAKVLDVNMGTNGIDEKEMMLKAVNMLSIASSVPLSIDSSYVDVVEAALRIYPGRALINSISLEPEKVDKLLPIAKKYGAMFILLPLSDKGLPKSMEEKHEIIETIIDRAAKLGLTKEDILVDGLVTTIGANKNAANEVFSTIEYCKANGLATICGLSNVSFGLPERGFVNSAFLTIAISKGLTTAIANPSQALLTNAAYASDLLLNKDGADIDYINGVKSISVTENKSNNKVDEESGHPIYNAVIKGRDGIIVGLVKEELKKDTKPGDIINDYLIEAINEVGKKFEKKEYFLPQLIASAHTMEIAIEYLEPMLKNGDIEEKETVVIATVKGDIHDIGKNLVALMLKNHGYNVIDLGKDVDAEVIVETAKKENAAFIGLSALMTTTMMEIKTVVDLAHKENVKAKIIIGGAVVTQSFCDEIGADGYSEDAQEAVLLVERLSKEN